MSEATQDTERILRKIPIAEIIPNPRQARRTFSVEKLDNLAASIAERGVVQPVLVRKCAENGTYQLIAGERRWRASKQIGLDAIPAIVSNASDEDAAYLALIENIQREELSELDEAYAFSVLIEQGSGNVQGVVDRVGKSRTYVEDRLVLLNLIEEVQRLFAEKKINMAQAKVLAQISDPIDQAKMARIAVQRQLGANKLHGCAQHVIAQNKSHSRDKRNPAFARVEKTIIGLFDLLEVMDPASYTATQQKTLAGLFSNLREALREATEKFSKSLPTD